MLTYKNISQWEKDTFCFEALIINFSGNIHTLLQFIQCIHCIQYTVNIYSVNTANIGNNVQHVETTILQLRDLR